MESLRQLKSQIDRVGAVVLTLIGALCLVLGYFGVSSQGLVANQIPYIVSGGLGGIFFMGVGAALWLSADLRDEWKKLDRIESVLESGLESMGLGRDFENRPTIAPLGGQAGTGTANWSESDRLDSSARGDAASRMPDSPFGEMNSDVGAAILRGVNENGSSKLETTDGSR